MRTILKILVLAGLIAPVAYAQGPVFAGLAPVFEVGGGYSYINTSVPSQNRIAMNGGFLTGNADFTRRFGVVADFGYARNPDVYAGHSADLLTYMAGPAYYPWRMRRLSVYTRLLLGGARETGVNLKSDRRVVLGYVNRFAWAFGGGVQYHVTRSVSVRLGADYLRTSFFTPEVTVAGQSGLRSTASVIYTFGGGHR
jgi:opacity protein-like surface antigen